MDRITESWGGFAAARCGNRLGDRILVGAGIDGVDLHIRMRLGIRIGQTLDGFSGLAADGDREIELQVNSLGRGPGAE